MSLWEHLLLTALRPDSITAAALTKHIPGILKISLACKSFYIYHFLCKGHSLSLKYHICLFVWVTLSQSVPFILGVSFQGETFNSPNCRISLHKEIEVEVFHFLSE